MKTCVSVYQAGFNSPTIEAAIVLIEEGKIDEALVMLRSFCNQECIPHPDGSKFDCKCCAVDLSMFFLAQSR